MRLIDADALLEQWSEVYTDVETWHRCIEISTVEAQPTIETIYGYRIEDLAQLAEVCERNGITEFDMEHMRNITDYIVNTFLQSLQEQMTSVIEDHVIKADVTHREEQNDEID